MEGFLNLNVHFAWYLKRFGVESLVATFPQHLRASILTMQGFCAACCGICDILSSVVSTISGWFRVYLSVCLRLFLHVFVPSVWACVFFLIVLQFGFGCFRFSLGLLFKSFSACAIKC